MKQRDTEHFIVCYSENENSCIDKVLDILENSYERITGNLQQELNQKLTVEIYSNFKELHVALGFPDAPDWIRGGLRAPYKVAIASPLNPPPGSNFDNVLNTAVHEFVHIIVNKINALTPRWLNEGIACFEGKDNNETWIKNTLKNGTKNNAVPALTDLDTGEDFETFFKRDGYQYSYSIVEYIVEAFGYQSLIDLIKSPKDFIGVLGVSQQELEENWKEYIRNNYGEV